MSFEDLAEISKLVRFRLKNAYSFTIDVFAGA